MNKSKKVLLTLFSLILSSLLFGQQQKLLKVWDASTAPSNETKDDWHIPEGDDEIICFHYGDGGSLGILFRKNDEEKILIHDRSYRVITIKGTDGFPDIQRGVKRDDGLLYLGEENFIKRTPARVNGQLFLEFEQLLKKWIENHDPYETHEFREVLDVAERMRSNNAVDTTAANARLFDNETSKSTTPDVEAMTEAAVVSP